MKKILNNEIFSVVLVIFGAILFLWWIHLPMKVIYDPNSTPLWIDDDPEGGRFPRR